MRIITNATRNDKKIEVQCEINRNNEMIEFSYLVMDDGYYSFSITIDTELKAPTPFIPAIWYRGNDKGEGCFPSQNISTTWAFYENRMTYPGLICLSDNEKTVITKINKAENDDEVSTVSWQDNQITYSIPGEEKPFSYRGKKALVKDEKKKGIFLKKGERYTRTITLRSYDNPDPLKAYESFIRERNEVRITPPFSWDEYETTKLIRLLNLVRKDSDNNAYLLMGEGNGELQSVYNFTSASFLVKSIEAASAFLKTDKSIFEGDNLYLQKARERIAKLFKLKNDYQMLETIAIKISNYFLKGEIKPGLFQDNYNIETGECGGYLGIGEHPEFKFMVNTRCNGEALSSFLEIYKRTKDINILNLCIRVATFYLDAQLDNGNFGRWWDLDGKCCNENGTNGAYIAVFLIKLREFYSNIEIDKAIEKALKYYSTLALNGEFYGDTLDADSSDKEAGVSLLSLFLEAIEHNLGDKKVLVEAAKYSASFIISYIFQEELYLPKESPLYKAGFFFQGVTSVSVAHNHLDFYGLLIAKDFLRLYNITNDEFYKEQAFIMADGCRQLIGCERNNYLGRSEDFYGWQPEQLNYTSWEYFSRSDKMNGYYDIDISWSNVLGYSSYLEIKEELKKRE